MPGKSPIYADYTVVKRFFNGFEKRMAAEPRSGAILFYLAGS